MAILFASPSIARSSRSFTTGACAVPAAGAPLWVDYADTFVRFSRVFRKSGVVGAVAHRSAAAEMRRAGAAAAYWEMDLKGIVGTPSAPANPASVPRAAARIASAAASVTGCTTPPVALNELFGAQLRTPWSATNRTYRSNVLDLLRQLTARGVRPYLFVSQGPDAHGAAGDWWRAAGQIASIVREVYVPAPTVARNGGVDFLRFELRRAVRGLTRAGVPSANVGIALGFQTTRGQGGRDGLSPASAWFDVVKIEALATRQVALELGVGSIWSWGWATWSPAERDPAKQIAACVYLWARDPALCNGPAAAGRNFDSSRGGFVPRPVPTGGGIGLTVLSAGQPTWLALRSAPQLTGRIVDVERRVGSAWQPLARIVLTPFGPQRLRVRLRRGPVLLRLAVARDATPGGAAFTTPPRRVRVR